MMTGTIHGSNGRLASVGKKRTRTGCLNCRRKRRKCDETKPQCGGCQHRRESCEWGIKVSFRPENAHSMGPDHPSMQAAISPHGQSFKIVNVTSEVVRDYYEETVHESLEELNCAASPPSVASEPKPPISAQAFDGTSSLIDPSTSLLDPLVLGTPSAPLADVFLSPQWSDSVLEDGIFLPGSEYQELHAALRSRIIDTARSTLPSRVATPEAEQLIPGLEEDVLPITTIEVDELYRQAQITPEQEYKLWQNYINEIAPWMDKFDNHRHFELVLPVLARSQPYVRFCLLALSARQMERKSQSPDSSCSLALYSHAIHLLSPALQQRTDVVLASCVVLSVLEMMSCSPKAWRRHLDGCAALIQALGITGVSGGLGQAAFWIFARMETWGSVTSSERTLIPVDKWIGAGHLNHDVSLLLTSGAGFDMYANHITFLSGHVVDLLCSSAKWEQRHSVLARPAMEPAEYVVQWTRLFEHLERWYRDRPEAMKPLLTLASAPPLSFSPSLASASAPQQPAPSHPFQTLLYGNGPAVAGNQMYHTAALLMLKHKPVHLAPPSATTTTTTAAGSAPPSKPHSILWHARHICAISLSNSHHGCWTNSIQPLWVAGQHMSHPTEHRAILDLYARIERETGWATRWRADDLKEYWGEW